MFDWQMEMATQRQRELLDEAKRYRLVAEACIGLDKHSHWTSRTLCRLGTLLVSLGRWLQNRSGAAPAASSSLVFLAGHETTASRQNGLGSLKKVA